MDTLLAFFTALADFFSSDTFRFILLAIFVTFVIGVLYRFYIFLRKKAIEKILYSRAFSEEGVHAGDSVLLTEVIYNPTLMPLFCIDVGCYISTGLEFDGEADESKEQLQYFTSRFQLPPFSKITRIHDVRCKIRNHYVLDTIEIYCDKKYSYISSPAELFVYPEPLNTKDPVLPQLNLLGNEMAKNRYVKDPFMVAGLRNYLPGDSYHSINFKASARSVRGGVRQLMVNNNDFSSQLNIMIYMDFDAPRFLKMETPQYEKLIERGLSYSVEIMNETVLQGGKVGFAANAKAYDGSLSLHYRPFAGMVHMMGIFKSLASISPMSGSSFPALLDIDLENSQLDTDICIITFHANVELENKIRQFRRLGRGVTVITLDETI